MDAIWRAIWESISGPFGVCLRPFELRSGFVLGSVWEPVGVWQRFELVILSGLHFDSLWTELGPPLGIHVGLLAGPMLEAMRRLWSFLAVLGAIWRQSWAQVWPTWNWRRKEDRLFGFIMSEIWQFLFVFQGFEGWKFCIKIANKNWKHIFKIDPKINGKIDCIFLLIVHSCWKVLGPKILSKSILNRWKKL